MSSDTYDGSSEIDGDKIAARFHAAQTADEYTRTIDKPRLTRRQLDGFRYEISRQPNWRREMAIDEDFQDGHQFTQEELDDYADRGIPAVAINLGGPTIDLLCGMEAKTRSDWVVRPEASDDSDDLALAMSQKLSLAEKQTHADDACSSALRRQVIGGLGIVEIAYEADPFRYPYRVESHDWREFGFDPLGIRDDLSDSRFLRRSKFFDREELAARFQDKADQIKRIGPSWDFGFSSGDEYLDQTEEYRSSDGILRDYSRRDIEWLDSERDRLLLDEVWYRVFVRGEVLRLPDLTSIRFDSKNPVHLAAVEQGAAKLVEASWSEVRVAFFIGPLRLQDIPTPYPHRDFPYVLFWGQREGRSRLPYGVWRRMRPMQREINARRSKMMWALSARRVKMTKGIVDDIEETRQESARPDAVFELNNVPNGIFQIDDNQVIGDQQYKVLADSIQRIQDIAGVYQTQLGKREGGADSGIAINSLIEQGSTTVAPIFASYRSARARVGQMLLALVMKDLADQENVPVKINTGQGKRTVMLNKPKRDERTGMDVLENNVSSARMKVSLDDIPSTATFRQQQFNRISEFIGTIQKVNPEVAAKYLDLLVEASDVPNKQEFVERIRADLGVNGDPGNMTPEQQQEAQQKAQAQQKQMEMADAAAQGNLELLQAKIAESNARAEKMAAETQAQGAELQTLMAKMVAEVEQMNARNRLAEAQAGKVVAETAQIETSTEIERQSPVPEKVVAQLRWD